MRVRCHYHQLTMNGDDLRQHEIDHHAGTNIAVEMIPDDDINGDDPKEIKLRDSGLLWLVNKALLHPRGYALGVAVEHRSDHRLFLYGDGSEPWTFQLPEEEENDLFAKVQDLLRNRKLNP